MAAGLKQEKTDLVSFEIQSGGSKIKEIYQVLSISVNKIINKIPTAQIVLIDGSIDKGKFDISSSKDFEPGAEITIKAGYHGKNEEIFKGIVVKHGISVKKSRNSVLTIELKDEAVKMTIGSKRAYFIDKKDSEIIEELIGNSGLKKDVKSTSVTHTRMVQYNATDWDFMMMRAEANGMLVFVDKGEVVVKPPVTSGEGKVKVIYGSTIKEFEAEVDARNQYSAVKTSSWDYASQAMVEAEAKDPGIKTNGNFDEKKLADVIGLESIDMVHTGQVTEPELQAWADSQLLRSRLSKVIGRVCFIGFADIKIGDLIELEGVGERFSGNAYVAGVRHEITNGYWDTNVQFGLPKEWLAINRQDMYEKPASSLLPPIHGLQIGVVTKLEGDPDGEERIQVKVPVISTEEDGIWVRVATLDAGDTRGSFFRPEIDDEVVLGFLNDDPREAVVLGMLNSSSKPAPIAATDDNHEKGFFTRSEMKFVFNDDEISVKIETPGGNIVTISDDKKGITLEDQNGNKIEMNDKGIAIESAKDFTIKATGDVKVEGVNIELKSSAEFKIDGGAGAEVSTSAIAKIKGSLVQIN